MRNKIRFYKFRGKKPESKEKKLNLAIWLIKSFKKSCKIIHSFI